MDNFSPEILSQTSNAVPPSALAPFESKPKMKMSVKVFVIVFLLIAISGGFVFFYKDSLFKSKWEKETNAWMMKFNKDSDTLNSQIGSINMATLLDESSAQKIGDILKSAQLSIGAVSADIQNIRSYLNVSPDVQGLSVGDQSSRSDYLTCFEGRAAGLDIISATIDKQLQFITAFGYLKSYENEINNFTALKNNMSIIIRQKDDDASTLILSKIRDTSLLMKGYLDKAYEILKYDSLKTQSLGYQALASGFADMSIAIQRKDVALLQKSTTEIAKGKDLIDSAKGQGPADWQKWFDDNVKSGYEKGNEEFSKVQNICFKAETESKLR